MTEPVLEYIRGLVYAQGSIPEGQLALYDIIYELARRIDALEAAQPSVTPKVLYEGEADVMGYGIYVSTPEPLCGRRRVHIVVTAMEGVDES